MKPNLYIELFILDEATAFAADHRPCFECGRAVVTGFKTLGITGNPNYRFTSETSIPEIDKILHQERVNKDGSKATYQDRIDNLSNGTFIVIEDPPRLVYNRHMHLWMPNGHNRCRLVATVVVLTPQSIVNAIFACYLLPRMAITQS